MTPSLAGFLLAGCAALLIVAIRVVVRSLREGDPGRVSPGWIRSRKRDDGAGHRP